MMGLLSFRNLCGPNSCANLLTTWMKLPMMDAVWRRRAAVVITTGDELLHQTFSGSGDMYVASGKCMQGCDDGQKNRYIQC